MASGAVINMELKNESKNVPNEDGIVVVQIEKSDKGLGFNIVGGSDDPHIAGNPSIFISKIRPESPAAKVGTLNTGDRIISVNGQDMGNLTHDDAVQLLRDMKGLCEIVVERDAESRILKRAANYVFSGSSSATAPSTSSNDSPKNVPKSILKKTMAATTTMTITPPEGNRLSSNICANEFAACEREAKELVKQNLNNAALENFAASSSSVVSEQESLYNGGFIHRHEEPDDDDDKSVSNVSVSNVSVAPSTTSYYEEMRRAPAEPAGILDPTNPSVVTEILVVTIGVAAIAAGTYGAYRYFSRR